MDLASLIGNHALIIATVIWAPITFLVMLYLFAHDAGPRRLSQGHPAYRGEGEAEEEPGMEPGQPEPDDED